MEKPTEKSSKKSGGSEGSRGNTKRARCWLFTWNNFKEKQENKIWLESYCRDNCKDYSIQEECGENGTNHLQGYWEFNSQRSFASIKKEIPKEIHFEPCKKPEAAKKYCEKKETKVEGGVEIRSKLFLPDDPLKGKELFEWQKMVMKKLEEQPDPRKIIWIYSKTGNNGKTSLAKSICINYPNVAIYISGKASDMKFGIFKFIDGNKRNLLYVLINIPRSNEEVDYGGIEVIKDGIFYNTKYECGMVMYNPPHVFVFANRPPDMTQMSLDRWEIICLDKDEPKYNFEDTLE